MHAHDFLTFLFALASALGAFAAAYKGHSASRKADSLMSLVMATERHIGSQIEALRGTPPGAVPGGSTLDEILRLLRALQVVPGRGVPPGDVPPVPGTSINDVLRYWDLLTKLRDSWQMVQTLPAGKIGSLPVLKAKVNGRRVQVGPTPIEFDD